MKRVMRMLSVTLLLFPFRMLTAQHDSAGDPILLNNPWQGKRMVESLERPRRPYAALHVNRSIVPGRDGIVFPLDNYELWQVGIRAKGASMLNLHFDHFLLGEEDELLIRDTQTGRVLLRMDKEDNRPSGRAVSGLLHSEEILLEFHALADAPLAEKLSLSHIAWFPGTDEQGKVQDFGGSQGCMINANCEESTGWESQVRSVVRMLCTDADGEFWCTGSVVNNVREDRRPLVLGAMHCALDQSDVLLDSIYFDQYVFYFNFESPDCEKPAWQLRDSLEQQSLTGARLLTHSNDEGGNSGSDFLLFELMDSIPDTFNVYYAGWDAGPDVPTSGVSIHHPAGDIKKISTYSDSLYYDAWSYDLDSTHWGVEWVPTLNGWSVTEGGSSGSPLFNSSGLIIGTLTGGYSHCLFPDVDDIYGRMNYHWDKNQTDSLYHLKYWLDPDDTGTLQLQGKDFRTGIFELHRATALVYPNPNTGTFSIQFSQSVRDIHWEQVFLTDVQGRRFNLTVSPDPSDPNVLSAEAPGLPPGLYFLGLRHRSQMFNLPVMIIH